MSDFIASPNDKTRSISLHKTSPEVIRLAVTLYVRLPLSVRNVEDLLYEGGVALSHETVRFWWNRFGPMFESPHLHQLPSRNNKVIRRTVLSRLSSPLKAMICPPPYALGFWHLIRI
jgi:hypothetical protein